MLLGLRTVIYKVPDLAAAKSWYAETFSIQPYFDEPFYVGFNVGGYELGLDPDTNGSRDTGQATAYWGVTNLRQTMENLRSRGVSIVNDTQEVGGDILVSVIADPFGNCIGLIENPFFALPS